MGGERSYATATRGPPAGPSSISAAPAAPTHTTTHGKLKAVMEHDTRQEAAEETPSRGGEYASEVKPVPF